jgi:glycosyltransferase involved in cell wall biosynthesis
MIFNNASYGYFGLFLSREMHRFGHLSRLYTNLPGTRLHELPRDKYKNQPALAAPMALRRLGFHRLSPRVDYVATRLFDRWVASALEPCDVYHCFSSFGLQSFEAAKARHGALTIVERGSSHARYQRDLLVDEYARWGHRFAGISERDLERQEREYEICDRITVQSTFSERTFLARGIPQQKIIKLPLGVDVGTFRPAPKNDEVFRVLYAGVCSLRKGIPYLLEAMEGLQLANFEFAINGSIRPELRDLMRAKASVYRYLGFQPLDKLREVYSSASVLVLPTIEDGFAKVVTEAMACGVPVIATDHCGALDVIDDGVEGFIVPVRDAKAIRERVLYLYENPDVRDAMGQAALTRVRKVSGWNSYGERAQQAYLAALRAHRALAA